MSELGERFAREEMERDERMEMLIEDLGLKGPALEEYLRVHRQIEMEMMMDELRGEEQFSSPAAQRTLDEIERHVKNGRYFGQETGREVVRLKPGNPKIRTLDDLFNVLLECWCKETAYPSCQKDWSPDDPSYGQCARRKAGKKARKAAKKAARAAEKRSKPAKGRTERRDVKRRTERPFRCSSSACASDTTTRHG